MAMGQTISSGRKVGMGSDDSVYSVHLTLSFIYSKLGITLVGVANNRIALRVALASLFVASAEW